MKRKKDSERGGRRTDLYPADRNCRGCGKSLVKVYERRRKIVTLKGPLSLVVHVMKCGDPQCARKGEPVLPETERQIARPYSKYGLDVVRFVGSRRWSGHRTLIQIRRELRKDFGLDISQRTIAHLSEIHQKYDSGYWE